MHLTVGLIHALPVHERRVYNRQEAASFVGVCPGHFKKLVNDGIMPAPLAAYGRVQRWDKAALEQALDSARGADGSTALSAYDQWRKASGQG